MSSLTVAYTIHLATLASMYRFCVERERMAEWPRYVEMALNVRHPREVASLVNMTHYANKVNVPSRRDMAAGLEELVRL